MRLELAVPVEVGDIYPFQVSVHGRHESVDARVASCSTPSDGAPRVFEIVLEFTRISSELQELLAAPAVAPGNPAS
jgi:hypothetical protein